MSGPADVVHDLFATVFKKRFANARAKSFEHLVPGSPGPFSASARPGPLHRIKNAIGIVYLGNSRGTFCAKTSAARWMFRIAFKLIDPPGFLIDVGEKAASRLTVKADRRNQLVVLFDASRPSCGIVLHPVIPLLNRRVGRKMTPVALKVRHCEISILQLPMEPSSPRATGALDKRGPVAPSNDAHGSV